MRRRTYLAAAAFASVGLAGCSGDGDVSSRRTTDKVFDREISDLREQIEEVRAGQRVDVEVWDVSDGEMLLFIVGDGTGYAYTDRFYRNRTTSYTFKSDGSHKLLFYPKRSEEPMNEDVTISVTAWIKSD